MNIFVLHTDPETCARMHCDKHVVKMISETVQLLCTCHHFYDNHDVPYKACQLNHPCNRWLRESKANYRWLYNLGVFLYKEYKHRYGDKEHKSGELLLLHLSTKKTTS